MCRLPSSAVVCFVLVAVCFVVVAVVCFVVLVVVRVVVVVCFAACFVVVVCFVMFCGVGPWLGNNFRLSRICGLQMPWVHSGDALVF